MKTLRLSGKEFVVDESAFAVEISWEEWTGDDDAQTAACDALESNTDNAALVVANDGDLTLIGDALSRFSAIILQFPAFTDGRAYSQARLLRDRYGFKGIIQARGDVLCDQAQFMVRSGFTALEIGDQETAPFFEALKAFSDFYQTGADGTRSVFQRRAKPSAAA
ncbi:MAG: DUF934 domain-containing protein [Pseudomonadota bacterium]